MFHLPTDSFSQRVRELKPLGREAAAESAHVATQRCKELNAGQLVKLKERRFILKTYKLQSQC